MVVGEYIDLASAKWLVDCKCKSLHTSSTYLLPGTAKHQISRKEPADTPRQFYEAVDQVLHRNFMVRVQVHIRTGNGRFPTEGMSCFEHVTKCIVAFPVCSRPKHSLSQFLRILPWLHVLCQIVMSYSSP